MERRSDDSRIIGLVQPGVTGLRPMFERGQQPPWGRRTFQRCQNNGKELKQTLKE